MKKPNHQAQKNNEIYIGKVSKKTVYTCFLLINQQSDIDTKK